MDELKTKLSDLKEKLVSKNFSGQVVFQKDEKTIFSYISGFADRVEERLINEDTLFQIASGTKFLTALAIGKLIEMKGLSLDTKASDLLDLHIRSYNKNVTLRQLLSHTSGIPDYLDEEIYDSSQEIDLAIPNYKLYSPKDYIPLFPKAMMQFEPGSAFKYNNGAFVYLGMIIERLSGKSYKDFVNNDILKPIGITRSGVHPMNQLLKNSAYGYILQEEGWKSSIYEVPIQAGGDGGVWMSAKDMLVIWQAFYAGKIISKSLKKEFVRVQDTMEADATIHYGLGVWLKETPQGMEAILVGQDPGVSFKSSYIDATKTFKFTVSNTSEGVWEVVDEINGIML